MIFCQKPSKRQKEAVQYISADILSLDIVIKDLKDSWDQWEIDRYCERVMLYINIILQGKKKVALSECLQTIYIICDGLTENNILEPKKFQYELTFIFNAIQRKHISLPKLKEIISFIIITSKETAQAYADLADKAQESTIYNLLKNEFIQALKQSNDVRVSDYDEYIIYKLQICYLDYIFHVNSQLLQNQDWLSKSSKCETFFNTLLKSKDVVSSIIELKEPQNYCYFFKWLPVLIDMSGHYVNQDHSIEDVFKICYSEFNVIINCYENKLVNHIVYSDINTQLRAVIEYHDEIKKITLTSPDDEHDQPYYGMTHPKHNFDNNAVFDYTTAISNISNFFKSHDLSDIEEILFFLPHVKLLRGKRISSFKNGCGQVYNIVFFVQVEDNTRKVGFSYDSSKLHKGERSLITSIDFVPSKEGAWEFLLLVHLYKFTIITSEQSIPDWFSEEKAKGAFSSWNFVPRISESDDFYYVSFVKYVFGSYVDISYVRYCIEKRMPHFIKNEIIDSISKKTGILF